MKIMLRIHSVLRVTLPVMFCAAGVPAAEVFARIAPAIPSDMSAPSKAFEAKAEIVEPPGNGNGTYAASIPAFKLKDPLGAERSAESLHSANGMLLMVTVPNLTQYEVQKRWERLLRKQCWPTKHAPVCAVLQDISQQKVFKDKVRRMIREKFEAEQRMVCVLDEDGAVRRALGVATDETVLLVVDPQGRVVHHESAAEPDQQASDRLADQAWNLANRPHTPSGYFLDPRDCMEEAPERNLAAAK